MDVEPNRGAAELGHYGLLAVEGGDAIAFLHAQLTNDIEHLPADRARYAGWCSAKGRLLATFLVMREGDRFLLQLARDLVPAVAKRLALYVLRSKVRLTDASAERVQFGLWGEGAEVGLVQLGLPVPAGELEVTAANGMLAVAIAARRYLVVVPSALRGRIGVTSPPDAWRLAEIDAGRPLVVQATQDLFIPQMLNLELTGGVDFRKGCYPGQEIVARSQYRGQLKRRMVRLRSPVPLSPGQDLYSDDFLGQPSGTVVNFAGGEALAVLQVSTAQGGAAVRAAPGSEPLELLPLPYSS